jgi:hypothetical protein
VRKIKDALILMVDVGSKALFYCDGCIVNPPAESAAVISTYHIVWILLTDNV